MYRFCKKCFFGPFLLYILLTDKKMWYFSFQTSLSHIWCGPHAHIWCGVDTRHVRPIEIGEPGGHCVQSGIKKIMFETHFVALPSYRILRLLQGMQITLVKNKIKIFLIYKEIQNGAVAKSYMTNSLPIYGEIFAHFLVY
jgi:hypothetical protein